MLKRLNVEPFNWTRGFTVDERRSTFSEFHCFLKHAGISAGGVRRQDLAFLFAYLVCRWEADTFPTAIVMSSADLERTSSLSVEQRAILALPKEATALGNKEQFVTYLRWNNGGLMRMVMAFRKDATIHHVEIGYVAELAVEPPPKGGAGK
jgi:hypothetical protein